MHPDFGLLLSCFGHARAKNNSEFPCGLELCLTFRLGLSPVVLLSSQDCEGIVLLWVCSGWSSDCAGLAAVEGLLNPTVFGLVVLCPLSYV